LPLFGREFCASARRPVLADEVGEQARLSGV
jgi:hypothetical protein